MTRNPLLNALCAILYISVLVSIVFYGEMLIKVPDRFSIVYPIGFLSLFVFSAATMGFLFLYQPLLLLMEGKRKEAVDLFLKTLAAFGAAAAVMVGAGLYLAQGF